MKLLEVLNEVKDSDLDAIQAELDRLRQEVRDLEAIEKIVAIKLNGAPEKKARRSPTPKTPSPNGDGEPRGRGMALAGHRERALKYLVASGAASRAAIIDQCQIPNGYSSTNTFDFHWFTKLGSNYALTETGKAAARELGFLGK